MSAYLDSESLNLVSVPSTTVPPAALTHAAPNKHPVAALAILTAAVIYWSVVWAYFTVLSEIWAIAAILIPNSIEILMHVILILLYCTTTRKLLVWQQEFTKGYT